MTGIILIDSSINRIHLWIIFAYDIWMIVSKKREKVQRRRTEYPARYDYIHSMTFYNTTQTPYIPTIDNDKI